MNHNEIIYQIFVRNYSKNGTFDEVTKDLKRIKDLGTTIIYLMPIHEIGIKGRKGTYGSPYAIKDYFSISKDLGTLEDFKRLIDKTHKMGMRIIIDMVFNHTAKDSVLLKDHEDFYFHKDGKLCNRVGEWSDIIDLDYKNPNTQTYLLEVLKYWVDVGVDGFRFDVASMIPLSFFKEARKQLGKDVIFFGESIDPWFSDYLKTIGDNPTPDEKMYPTFDFLYNYNYFADMLKYFRGECKLKPIVEVLNKDGANLRALCLENHDNERISKTLSESRLEKMLDFFAFIKGNVFIYAGQEYGAKHKPELFEKDPVDWSHKNEKAFSLYQRYIEAKKDQKEIMDQSFVLVEKDIIEVTVTYKDNKKERRSFSLN